tara:strand:- start:83 stop:1084 length:1002 start_codon:yes stop_codon:yes gene_type:complete
MSTIKFPFRPSIFSPTQGDFGTYSGGDGYYSSNPFSDYSGYNYFNSDLSFPNVGREQGDIFSNPFSSSSAQGIFGKSGGSIFQQGGGGTATDLIGDTKVGLPAADAAAAGGGMFSNMSTAQQMQMAGGIGGVIQGLVGRKKRRAAQRKAKKEYEKQRSLYQALDTSNLAAGFGNAFENMENTYEDMTVNQQQAQFMAQQNQQSQANTMQALRGAAGGSGIAGLAQIIANQSQLATQKASASIGLQEAQNQKFAAQGAAQNQMAERKGEYQAQAQRLAGAREARGLDYQKQEMELGFAMQEKAAADQAVQAANAALYGGIGSLTTQALTGGFGG